MSLITMAFVLFFSIYAIVRGQRLNNPKGWSLSLALMAVAAVVGMLSKSNPHSILMLSTAVLALAASIKMGWLSRT
jgi:hypothetical protein